MLFEGRVDNNVLLWNVSAQVKEKNILNEIHISQSRII